MQWKVVCALRPAPVGLFSNLLQLTAKLDSLILIYEAEREMGSRRPSAAIMILQCAVSVRGDTMSELSWRRCYCVDL